MLTSATVGSFVSTHLASREHRYEFPETEYELYTALLNRVQNDYDIANRLVDYEKAKSPFVDKEKLLRNAIERWERDNRL